MPLTGAAPVEVTFTDESTPLSDITYWAWDFGDGYTSEEQNPVHQYDDPGYYTVTLDIASAKGIDNVTDVVHVTGLIARWLLSEASGTREDIVGVNDLADYGSVGLVDGGADFTRASQQSLYCSIPTLDFSVGVAFTGWVYLPTIVPDAAYQYFVSLGTADWGGGLLQLYNFDGEANLQGIVGSATLGDSESVTVAATRDAWHFFCVQYDPATKKVGLRVDNGAPSLSAAITAHPVLDPQNRLSIGSRSDYNVPLGFSTSRLKKVRLFDRTLTTDEVNVLYNAGVAI